LDMMALEPKPVILSVYAPVHARFTDGNVVWCTKFAALDHPGGDPDADP